MSTTGIVVSTTGGASSSAHDRNNLSPGCWNTFRKYGVRPTKSIIATVADIAGDWVFYFSVLDNEDEVFDKFELPLLVFACVSSALGVLLLISLLMDFRNARTNTTPRGNSASRRRRRRSFGMCVKRMLAMEIFVEDIPQFVLAALVTAERGALTGYAVFNITTSAFNFVLNVLDMIEVEDEE